MLGAEGSVKLEVWYSLPWKSKGAGGETSRLFGS